MLTRHCLQLIDRGCKGIALFGTTGEGPSFSVDEKKCTLKKVILNGLDPKKIIFGNGASYLQDTVDLALAALENNCLACLIAPPCFFKNVTDEGVTSFYREVIQRISDPRLQVILYHIPQYTGVPITINIAKTLCTEFPSCWLWRLGSNLWDGKFMAKAYLFSIRKRKHIRIRAGVVHIR